MKTTALLLALCLMIFAQAIFAQEPVPAPVQVVQAPMSWTSPEGITLVLTIVGFVSTLLTSVFTSLGWKRASARATTMTKLSGVLVKGIEKARAKTSREAGTAMVKTIQEEALAHDVEELLNPIVREAQAAPDAPPVEVARAGTRRFEAAQDDTPEPPRRVS